MRVMVITHDAERRRGLIEFLRDRGYEVSSPSRRQDVLPMVKDETPDAMVLDLYIADPDGADTLRRVRAEGYTGKVVALAGQSVSSTLSACWNAGIDQVVGEIHVTDGPLDLGQIEAAIRASFNGDITQRAYQLWLRHGRPEGQDRQHWTQAEREIIGEPGSEPPRAEFEGPIA